MGKFISVPQNVNAMYNAEFGIWNPSEHYIWYLQDDELSLIWKENVFDLLNKEFNILIDDYEDEYIFYQELLFKRKELYCKLECCKCKEQIEKLKDMIDKSIDSKTLLSVVL